MSFTHKHITVILTVSADNIPHGREPGIVKRIVIDGKNTSRPFGPEHLIRFQGDIGIAQIVD
jgi:hypothetical protein